MGVKAACIQLNSSADIDRNLEITEKFIREAAANGAHLIVTPENTCHILTPATDKLKTAKPQESHPGMKLFAGLARELNVFILIGSMSISLPGDRIANRSFLFSPQDGLLAHYDKIHLFDVTLPSGESYRESDVMTPGDRIVVADTPFGKIGMSICYDLRFPHLYREMAKRGAQIFSIPAAFTVPTGQAHWEVLLRARAIETGSFVLAAAQTGVHHGDRRTYGHSLIVSPWGEILADAGVEPGIIYADIDPGKADAAREAIPALSHDRELR